MHLKIIIFITLVHISVSIGFIFGIDVFVAMII